jgi:hypothetical protein
LKWHLFFFVAVFLLAAPRFREKSEHPESEVGCNA